MTHICVAAVSDKSVCVFGLYFWTQEDLGALCRHLDISAKLSGVTQSVAV